MAANTSTTTTAASAVVAVLTAATAIHICQIIMASTIYCSNEKNIKLNGTYPEYATNNSNNAFERVSAVTQSLAYKKTENARTNH